MRRANEIIIGCLLLLVRAPKTKGLFLRNENYDRPSLGLLQPRRRGDFRLSTGPPLADFFEGMFYGVPLFHRGRVGNIHPVIIKGVGSIWGHTRTPSRPRKRGGHFNYLRKCDIGVVFVCFMKSIRVHF